MNVRTKLNKLTYIKEAKEALVRSTYRIKTTTKARMEVNVIGMTVYEAIPEVDKFIDNAVVSNLSTVRIVHGMGTGKLRDEIHKHLRKTKSVVSFEYATQSQGGSGATIVKLK